MASEVSKKSEMATPEPVSSVRLLLRNKFFMTRCHIDRRLPCSAGNTPDYYTLFRARNFAGGRRVVLPEERRASEGRREARGRHGRKAEGGQYIV